MEIEIIAMLHGKSIMRSTIYSQHRFIFSLVGLCLLYLMVEIFLNRYTMLAIDEFWFAHIIYHYKDALPYRDFAPYKTVLGYYLLLPPMLSAKGIIPTLTFTKQCLALLNTLILFISSYWLTRYFSRRGVLSSLIVLLTSDIVLSFSTNIRVDLLGYWFCFFALLCLMERRFLLAGLLIGLGFITTQKALWYIVASDIALAAQWLLYSRQRKVIWHIASYNLMAAFVMGLYIAFWSWLSDWHTVITSIFHEASVLYHLDWYDSARGLFWSYIVSFNPLVFALWPLSLLSLVVTYDHDDAYQQRFFIVIVGMVILFCLIPYKMIFPYYMQVSIPVWLILYSAFFSWLYPLFQPNQMIRLMLPKPILWTGLFVYLGIMIYVMLELDLPFVYLLFCLMPILLMTTIISHLKLGHGLVSLFRQLILIIMLFIGGIYPLAKFTLKTIEFNGDYQQAHVNVINHLLQDGSDYVAGIELIYNKTQRIAGLRQLVGPAIDYLASPSEKLRPFMLASLYQDPNATSSSVITALKNSDVKFYVNTYRVAALPADIRQYLQSQYEHIWGSIYLYAPSMSAGIHEITLKFTGRYLIEAQAGAKINLAGQSYAKHAILFLQKGAYLSIANQDYRLKLLPDAVKLLMDKKFQQEQITKIVW